MDLDTGNDIFTGPINTWMKREQVPIQGEITFNPRHIIETPRSMSFLINIFLANRPMHSINKRGHCTNPPLILSGVEYNIYDHRSTGWVYSFNYCYTHMATPPPPSFSKSR